MGKRHSTLQVVDKDAHERACEALNCDVTGLVNEGLHMMHKCMRYEATYDLSIYARMRGGIPYAIPWDRFRGCARWRLTPGCRQQCEIEHSDLRQDVDFASLKEYADAKDVQELIRMAYSFAVWLYEFNYYDKLVTQSGVPVMFLEEEKVLSAATA